MSGFSHFDEQGQARMVDVSGKEATERVATAKGRVRLQPETLALIEQGQVAKGDVLSVARLAGIMGAKRTPDLIPLCHPLALSAVSVDLALDRAGSAIEISATCRLVGRTGVEMEALPAVPGGAPAGKPFDGGVGGGGAVRIFPGAPLPAGADTIIIQEDVDAAGASITVREGASTGTYVRPAGLDFAAGELGLAKGRRL